MSGMSVEERAFLAELEAEAMAILEEDIALVQGVFGDNGQYATSALNELNPDTFEPYLKRLDRVKNCGKEFLYRIGIDGFPYRITTYCGAFRACNICLEHRAFKYVNRIIAAVDDLKGVKVIRTSSWDAVCIKRGLRKSEYLSFPQADGATVLFVIPDDNLPGDAIESVEDAESIDWLSVVCTPEGKRVSGGLGRSEEPVGVSVTTQNVVFKGIADEDHNLIDQAYAEAVEEVVKETDFSEIDVDNVVPLEEAIRSLTQKWILNVEFATLVGNSRLKASHYECKIKVGLDEITRIRENKGWETKSLQWRFTVQTEKNRPR